MGSSTCGVSKPSSQDAAKPRQLASSRAWSRPCLCWAWLPSFPMSQRQLSLVPLSFQNVSFSKKIYQVTRTLGPLPRQRQLSRWLSQAGHIPRSSQHPLCGQRHLSRDSIAQLWAPAEKGMKRNSFSLGTRHNDFTGKDSFNLIPLRG